MYLYNFGHEITKCTVIYDRYMVLANPLLILFWLTLATLHMVCLAATLRHVAVLNSAFAGLDSVCVVRNSVCVVLISVFAELDSVCVVLNSVFLRVSATPCLSAFLCSHANP